MRLIPVIPVLSLTAYAAGDVIGGKINLGQLDGELRSITITDNANQGPAGSILLFSQEPLVATTTDNAAFAPSTDLGKLIGIVTIPAYTTIASKKVATVGNLGIALKGSKVTAVIVGTGTPTFAAATDLKLTFGVEPNE